MDERVSRADVRRTYERIGPHFSETRAHPWPEVESFIEKGGGVETALDVGCGNGRHSAVLAEQADRVLGVDVSRSLLREASQRLDSENVTLLQGDATGLPIGTDRVGLAVYVATLHHLPERSVRLASLNELARVLTPAGRGLVSAWATAADRFEASAEAESGFDTTIDWTLPDGEIVPRFYHIYAPAEFERDLEDSDLEIDSCRISSGNCYAEVRGPQ